MSFLQNDEREQLRKLFRDKLRDPVTVQFYTQRASPLSAPAQQCQTCRETGELLGELAALSDKITIETHDFVTEAGEASRRGIDRIPAMVIQGKGRGTVRYFGVPAGYEFAVLIEALLDASRGGTALAPATREELAKLPGPVRLEVLVTPT
ncbi:MAG TPA: thioredoxin family protein [Gemmatimonadales bacterium]|nr:thioredoxin family protein [Gemmatimonadales bacterium]